MPDVLIVEDEPLMRWALRESFLGAGYSVHLAADGPEALAFAKEPGAHPDVAVLDYKLPGMSGISLIGELRHSGIDCPVIVMSAYGNADVEDAARGAGAAAFLNKPFDPGEMISAVKEARVLGHPQ